MLSYKQLIILLLVGILSGCVTSKPVFNEVTTNQIFYPNGQIKTIFTRDEGKLIQKQEYNEEGALIKDEKFK